MENTQLYISCNEKLPKQFALAQLLKDNNVTKIVRVKYIHAFRVRIDLLSVIDAEKLESCQNFIDKGWRMQRAMERNYSYGVIRNVDLEMSEANILKSISCAKPASLVSVNRLNRRITNEDGWIPSEAVRLCF